MKNAYYIIVIIGILGFMAFNQVIAQTADDVGLKLYAHFQYPESSYRFVIKEPIVTATTTIQGIYNDMPNFKSWDTSGLISVSQFQDANGDSYYIQISNQEYQRLTQRGGSDYAITPEEAYEKIITEINTR